MPIGRDLVAPEGIAPAGGPLPAERRSPFAWMAGPLRRGGEALRRGLEELPPAEGPPLPEVPVSPWLTGLVDRGLNAVAAAAPSGPVSPRPSAMRELTPPATPISMPDSAFQPLPGGGYATPSAPWNGAPPTPGAGMGLDAVRSFYGAPPRMDDYTSYNYVPGGGIPTRRVDPSFAQAMAAYNQGVNALLDRTTAMETAGLRGVELMGMPGGVPGALQTAADRTANERRVTENQFGPNAMLGALFNNYIQGQTAAGNSLADSMRMWQEQGLGLPGFIGSRPPTTPSTAPAAAPTTPPSEAPLSRIQQMLRQVEERHGTPGATPSARRTIQPSRVNDAITDFIDTAGETFIRNNLPAFRRALIDRFGGPAIADFEAYGQNPLSLSPLWPSGSTLAARGRWMRASGRRP